jgi:hypothetical protein
LGKKGRFSKVSNRDGIPANRPQLLRPEKDN